MDNDAKCPYVVTWTKKKEPPLSFQGGLINGATETCFEFTITGDWSGGSIEFDAKSSAPGQEAVVIGNRDFDKPCDAIESYLEAVEDESQALSGRIDPTSHHHAITVQMFSARPGRGNTANSNCHTQSWFGKVKEISLRLAHRGVCFQSQFIGYDAPSVFFMERFLEMSVDPQRASLIYVPKGDTAALTKALDEASANALAETFSTAANIRPTGFGEASLVSTPMTIISSPTRKGVSKTTVLCEAAELEALASSPSNSQLVLVGHDGLPCSNVTWTFSDADTGSDTAYTVFLFRGKNWLQRLRQWAKECVNGTSPSRKPLDLASLSALVSAAQDALMARDNVTMVKASKDTMTLCEYTVAKYCLGRCGDLLGLAEKTAQEKTKHGPLFLSKIRKSATGKYEKEGEDQFNADQTTRARIKKDMAWQVKEKAREAAEKEDRKLKAAKDKVTETSWEALTTALTVGGPPTVDFVHTGTAIHDSTQESGAVIELQGKWMMEAQPTVSHLLAVVDVSSTMSIAESGNLDAVAKQLKKTLVETEGFGRSANVHTHLTMYTGETPPPKAVTKRCRVEASARQSPTEPMFFAGDKPIEFAGQGRGLNVIEIHGEDKRIIGAKQFDTFSQQDAAQRFADYVDQVADGNILLVAANGDASSRMKKCGIQALTKIGGSGARLTFRASFVLMGKKGGAQGTAEEASSPSGAKVTVSQAFEFPFDSAEYMREQNEARAGEPMEPVAENVDIGLHEHFPYAAEAPPRAGRGTATQPIAGGFKCLDCNR